MFKHTLSLPESKQKNSSELRKEIIPQNERLRFRKILNIFLKNKHLLRSYSTKFECLYDVPSLARPNRSRVWVLLDALERIHCRVKEKRRANDKMLPKSPIE